MSAITINRVHTRMRLPSQALSERARLNRVVADALDRFLETAIERHGISPHSYLCIRNLHASVRLRLRQTESQLAENFAETIANAVLEKHGAESSVHYSSRVHALIDLARNVMSARFGRTWAWAQLGLWRHEWSSSAASTADHLLRVLASEPQYAVAVFAHVAPDQATIPMLLRWAAPRLWRELVAAACRTFGVASLGFITSEPAPEFPSSLVTKFAARTVLRSQIAQSFSADSTPRISDDLFTLFAVLVVLEFEPAVLRFAGAPARALLNYVATVLQRRASDDRIAIDGSDSAPSVGELLSSEDIGAPGDRLVVSDRLRADSASNPTTAAGRGSATLAAAAEEEAPPLDVRTVARTSLGGLVYLLNLVARVDLPALINRDHRLTQRGLRWSLHQLAQLLVAGSSDDPAVLAFAGLLPRSVPPSSGEQPPADTELAAIREYRGEIVLQLRKALADRLELPNPSDAALLDFVCQRNAQVSGDPGWIEISFALDDISTALRFAGLDLDPGWIPWLGVVVRFVYA